MTHYFLVAVVPGKTEDIMGKIEEMFEPFNENKQLPEYKHYLLEEEIQRMSASYQTTDLKQLARHMQDWRNEEGGSDQDGLYSWTTFNSQAKWDWYGIGGRYNGLIRNQQMVSEENHWTRVSTLEDNMLEVKLLDHVLECYALLTPDGIWHEMRDWDWSAPWDETQRETFEVWRKEEEQRWQQEIITLLQPYQNDLLVGVDIHI